jgi:hypothetical protein
LHDHENNNVCWSSLVMGAFTGAGLALLVMSRSGSDGRPHVSGAERTRTGARYVRDLAARAKEEGRQLARTSSERSRAGGEDTARAVGEASPSRRDYASAADYHGL